MQATEEITTTEQAPPSTDALSEHAAPADVDQDRAGESGRERRAARSGAMNDFLRGNLLDTSKPVDPDAAGESAPTDGQGDVKPAERGDPLRGNDGRFARRGVPEAVKSEKQRADEAEARLAALDPDKLRADARRDIEAEVSRAADQAALDDLSKAQQADVEKYRRLNDVPDYKLDPSDRQWLQDFKDKLDLFPEVKAFHEADTSRRIKAASDAHTQGLLSSLARHVKLPGVDEAAFRKLDDYGKLGDHLYEAGGRSRQPEIDKLTAENRRMTDELRQLRGSGRGGMGTGQEPPRGGRSSSAAPRDAKNAMNEWLRGQ